METDSLTIKWFLDELALTMTKRRYWLWRAVDQDGAVLDILVQSRRDQQAPERFLCRVLEPGDGVEPRVLITDKLASYVRAIKRVLTNVVQVARASAAIPGNIQGDLQPLPSEAVPSLS